MLCIRPSDSNGKVIPSYGHGQVDKWRLWFAQNNMRALWSMLMRSWAILGFDIHTICSRQNIGNEGCNCKFNNLFLGVWCVTEFKHLSMHLHFTYNLYQLWGLDTNGVWILPAHWVWHLDIIDMFWLWLNISPSGWNLFHCQIVVVKEQHMHFWTGYLVGLGSNWSFH
jgi:hypothetical protein